MGTCSPVRPPTHPETESHFYIEGETHHITKMISCLWATGNMDHFTKQACPCFTDVDDTTRGRGCFPLGEYALSWKEGGSIKWVAEVMRKGQADPVSRPKQPRHNLEKGRGHRGHSRSSRRWALDTPSWQCRMSNETISDGNKMLQFWGAKSCCAARWTLCSSRGSR